MAAARVRKDVKVRLTKKGWMSGLNMSFLRDQAAQSLDFLSPMTHWYATYPAPLTNYNISPDMVLHADTGHAHGQWQTRYTVHTRRSRTLSRMLGLYRTMFVKFLAVTWCKPPPPPVVRSAMHASILFPNNTTTSCTFVPGYPWSGCRLHCFSICRWGCRSTTPQSPRVRPRCRLWAC